MDIVNLFPKKAGAAPFAQGVLTAFNPLTGANSVNVQGATFNNLPLLNVPDVVNMAVGSVVMLAQLGGSYAIMGRVVVPSGALLNTSAVAFSNFREYFSNFAVTSSVATYASIFLNVPTWANSALVTVTALGNLAVTGAANTLLVQTVIQGSIVSASFSAPVPAAGIGFVTATDTEVISVTPGGTVTFDGQMVAGTGVAANAGTALELVASAIWQKV